MKKWSTIETKKNLKENKKPLEMVYLRCFSLPNFLVIASKEEIGSLRKVGCLNYIIDSNFHLYKVLF